MPATSCSTARSRSNGSPAMFRTAAAHRRALRRGAVRPLVVRGTGLDQLPAPQDRTAIRRRSPITLPEYLTGEPEVPGAAPSLSSWGYKGYCEVWLEARTTGSTGICTRPPTAWSSWRRHFPSADGLQQRALNQAARELLLAQSSDWAFIMKTGTMSNMRSRERKNICSGSTGCITILKETLLTNAGSAI